MTGIALPKATEQFDWSYTFLIKHMQAKHDAIHGKFFTPELMVAYNLDPESIEKLNNKSLKCMIRGCYDIVTKAADKDIMPKLHLRDEL